MLLYRVDQRCYSLNDTIFPQTTYSEKVNELQLEVEKYLKKFKPEKIPARNECLFLFYNLSSALIFCSKYGGYVYAVSINPDDIYWRGDMNMLDNIFEVFKITKCEQIRTDIVKRYWEEGAHTFQPCYEFLVLKAKVNKVVLTKDSAKDEIKSEIDKYNNLENSPKYLELLNEILCK